MSLWRQRSAIERAVANQLAPEDEAKLRNHLAGCLECRRYYDALSVQARILAGDPHASAAASERELARLMAALNPAPAAPRPLAWWPRFAVLAGAAAALTVGIISWRQSTVEPVEQISLRGDDASPAEVFGVWVVTAPRDGGELRRDISFPSDPVGRVRADEWIAFAKKGSTKGDFFKVVLVNADGQTLLLQSGKSVALDAGKWRAFAVGTPHEDPLLLAAAREAGVDAAALKLPGQPSMQVSGVIIVQP